MILISYSWYFYFFYCSSCKLVRFLTLSFERSIFFSFAPFDFVHFDVLGPSFVTVICSFIDDYICYCWVYLMKRYYDFLAIFNTFRTLVKTQNFAGIKSFRCGTWVGNIPKMIFLICLLLMVLFTNLLDTSKQNGVVERKHRHIVETTHSLFCQLMFLLKFGRSSSSCYIFD